MIHLIHGDFRTAVSLLKSNFFSAVITDPPYSPKYLPLWSDLAQASARVLLPSGWLISYSAQYIFPEVLQRVGEHLDYYWFGMSLYSGMNPPGYWKKRTMVVSYGKPWIVFNKPPQKIPADWIHDFIAGERIEKEFHEWQQSVDEAQALVRDFTKSGDWILDPMAGSGIRDHPASSCEGRTERCRFRDQSRDVCDREEATRR
jgi:hypothetical protein